MEMIEPKLSEAGFRLHALEVYNWGTFNSKIWSLSCHGATALLTGDNGSGKSTLVDALLTLLVPHQKRHYNQASGASSKKERTEISYVRGAYGKVKGDDQELSRVEYLRTYDDYSVVLARFRDVVSGSVITLAQLFWFEDGNLRKVFIVASEDLSISAHFTGHSTIKELRKSLRNKAGTEVYNQFNEYSAQFRKLSGLDSAMALELFSQTVSLKSIDNLNEFVRKHMLNEVDVHEQIESLKKHYENLDLSYKAIQKAKEQLDMLLPLMIVIDNFEKLQKEIADEQQKLQALPTFFAKIVLELVEEALTENQLQQSIKEGSIKDLEEERDILDKQINETQRSIEQDQISTLLNNIKQEILRLDDRIKERNKNCEQYLRLSKNLGYENLPSDEDQFAERVRQLQKKSNLLEFQDQEHVKSRDSLAINHENDRNKYSSDKAELESLLKRSSQIPVRNLEIRNKIASQLQIPEEKLPFAGELIQVRSDAKEWEGAIERVLRNFALSVLVPEEYYERVSQYVSSTHLQAKIVYYRVENSTAVMIDRDSVSEGLFYKVEVRQKSYFTSWVEQQLAGTYNYICCDSFDRFRREQKALNKDGLIKVGRSRHEKDDAYTIGDRSRYVLGWDNRQKIRIIQETVATLEVRLKRYESERADWQKKADQIRAQISSLEGLKFLESFSDIDIGSLQNQRSSLETEKEKIIAGSELLKSLQRRLEDLGALKSEKDKLLRSLLTEMGALKNNAELLGKRQEENRTLLETSDEQAECHDLLISMISGKQLRLDNVNNIESGLRLGIEDHKQKLEKDLSRQRDQIISRMNSFSHRFPEEINDMDSSIESIEPYRALCRRIKDEDLPGHERKFKEMLNQSVIQNIALFKASLEQQEEKIRARLDGLNISLKTIQYTPSTYIVLNAHHSSDTDIRGFREMLKNCLPDVGKMSDSLDAEQSFEKIREIIERLDLNERGWTDKVVDVRNWLSFSISERYTEDKTEKSHYSDSGGLSGGQKAKLAYTILASAVTYQYGLADSQQRKKSFRFIAIDEAFSKIDEANSKYAMELFRNLDLQLLVITPRDKIHLVEPYISAVHYVVNSEKLNNSRIHNLTIEEYRAEKIKYAQAYDSISAH